MPLFSITWFKRLFNDNGNDNLQKIVKNTVKGSDLEDALANRNPNADVVHVEKLPKNSKK